ncbi:autotransporter secretion outer membrane protein TamA [Colwellia chukchiensis]|uniref:Translocation and assembly module subunit TamA n=3 Tax=Colwellia chukchiensis TaxID=641665 RepID=A0A1H7NTV0_9GAMM|nr:autotransporter secretion outer membrane protein TamA [Colwellia chukchiensis]
MLRLFCLLNIMLLTFYCWQVSAQTNQQQDGTYIKVLGVDAAIKRNILRHLNSHENVIPLSLLGLPQADTVILRKASSALQALGYYQPKLALSEDEQGKVLTIELQSAVRWHQVNIELNCAAHLTAIADLIDRHPFKQGMVINHGQYSDFKNTLQRQAQASGLLNASFARSALNIDIAQSQANVDWQFNCGAQYRIGKITISGTVLSHDLISSYLNIQAGQAYNQADIIASQQALNRAGFFKSIIVEQQTDAEAQTVDITISIHDSDKYELKTLLGYGTDSGGKLGLSWRDRRVNDRAHQYVAAMELNNLRLDNADIFASVQYQIPLAKANNKWINQASFQIKNEEIGRSKTFTLESLLAKKLNPYWFSQWSIVAAQEQLQTDADIVSSFEYIVPSWQINYYSVTEPFSAIEGWRWQSTIRFSSQELSNPSIAFLQTDQRIKRIWALDEQWRLLARARFGATWMRSEDFNRFMPSNYRFFAGGDVSVRGYKHQSLSPVVENIALGGKHLFSSGLELDYLFKDNLRWALFADQGNAFNNWRDWKLYRAIGTGVRWITPVGAIRLDIAKALDGNKAWRVHVTIGPDL